MSDLPPDVAARLGRARKDAIRAKREGVLLVRRVLRPGEEPRSFIGGLPCLPDDLDWPVSTRTGLPFNFIAQIDLRDVPRPQGVFFPAEGMLWFFADFTEEHFSGSEHTRVLFDPSPGVMAREREAPANLPPLNTADPYGWLGTQHPRAFVEPKTGLFMHRFDTFYDRPYVQSRPLWEALEDFYRQVLAPPEERRGQSDESRLIGSVPFMKMIDDLREAAVRRATGVGRTHGGYWYEWRSGFGEAHWPATSVDAEYALMKLAGWRLSIGLKDPSLAGVAEDLAARVQERILMLRSLGPRPLTPAERTSIHALIRKVRHFFARFDYQRRQRPDASIREYLRYAQSTVRNEVNYVHSHTAFEILRTMPEPEKYLPAEMLHPYQELMFGSQIYFHQMFGHGSSPQSAPQSAEESGYVLLLQLGGSTTLGLPLMGDAAMHYWIPKKDLARGRFDRVEGTWEAG